VQPTKAIPLDSEHYATPWHGLFPVYLVSALLLTLVGSILPNAVYALIVLDAPALSASAQSSIPVIDFLIYPAVPLLLFYLATRFRLNLGRDYLPVVLSIFIGAAVGTAPWVVVLSYLGEFGSPTNISMSAIVLGDALGSGFETAFAGFAVILLSYRRRM
jgi:hypothetical protein